MGRRSWRLRLIYRRGGAICSCGLVFLRGSWFRHHVDANPTHFDIYGFDPT